MAKDLTAALAALSEQAAGSTTRADKSLPAATPVTAIPARSGSAKPGSSGGTGSIASPLTEVSYASRQKYAERAFTSTDGIIVFKIAPWKQLSFTDANLNPVATNYAEPT